MLINDIIEKKIDKYLEDQNIPNYFYQCFLGELIKIFPQIIIHDIYYDAEYDEDGNIITKTNEDIKDYSYKKQLDYYLTCENGTMGWGFAFTEACNQCNLQSLNQYYRKLDWMESDYFDSLITNKIIETLFSERQETTETYFMFRNNNFIKSKEGE